MNWADDSDAGGGEEAYPEPDPGMDDAAYDEPAGTESADDTDFDTEDDALDDDAAPADDEPTDTTGDEPADEPGETDTEQPQATGDEPADDTAIHIADDEIVGTDPDTTAFADDPAFEAEFPPDIALDPRPEPIDGEPWSDAALLGSGTETAADFNAYDYGVPPMDDLFAMDAAGGGDWDGLANSDDPAVASLARWWQPT